MKYPYLVLFLIHFNALAKDPFENFSEYGKLDESEIHQKHQGEFLYGDTELGFILTSGNTDSTTAKLKANIYQDFESWRNQYKFDSLFKRDLNEITGESKTTASRVFFSSQANYKLAQFDESFFVYGGYENDRFNGVAYKSTLVSGYGNRLLALKKDRIDFDIGPGLSAQKNTDNSSQSGFLIRIALQWERLISSRSRFNQAISYEQSLSGLSSRLKSETALVSRVNGALSVKFSYLYRYNSKPEVDKLSFDSETSATLVFNF
ncbi:DUF481 domain-containing protein [Pseudoalteromonas tunicata]|uniref:Orphan protein n=1 Tax=Pseudoalteromonas tunicata D2 TaxID=87626 RepID=A4CCG8_9GAMM|nr:DUF481 domain-containing protein [Pseudoalteromonas tunicata]ATC93763.1 hypothetical protein PTUN_a1070 [Pseudoalteromonas tunicata]AXT29585.1 DUF481 domain-containing protein [Pseudoalteromonas tunicata]EAR27261.1 hypothetical protein PTD2_14517 [Pseudoalteromonas tunicata D2]MDP4985103.1 DUF481 domain-containing protein [Pseudoalteromonas tunicata]MDP5215046.1 DUF481 domain-containing protein [Pseudoalteromonas tunicata]